MTLTEAVHHENAVITQQIVALEVHYRYSSTSVLDVPEYIELLRQKSLLMLTAHELFIENILNQLQTLIF